MLSLNIPYMERPVIERKANHKNKKLHELSITLCYVCGYSFDLKLCRKIDFIFEKISKREQMHTNTLYILPFYIDADYKKRWFFTSAPVFYACRYSFVTSIHVCCVLSMEFIKKIWDWVLSLIRAMYWDKIRDVWQCKTLGFYIAQCMMIVFYR